MDSIKFLDDKQRDSVGLNFIIENLRVCTPYGSYEKKNIKPFKRKDKKLLLQELDNIEKIVNSLSVNKDIYSQIEMILSKIKDISGSIKRCENLQTLDEVELYEIKYFSIQVNKFISLYENLNLNIDNIKFYKLDNIIKLLDPENKNIPTFYIYESYSENLKKIRYEKRLIEEKIFKEEDKEKLKILKDQRMKIVIQEEEEELRIRKFLTSEIKKEILYLKTNISSLGKIDLLIGKAKLSLEYNGVKPIIIDDIKVELKEAFNPYIKQLINKKNKEFTPISISLSKGTTVITGANMSGKSVSLKTTVLNLILANMGFFIFCKYGKIPILDFIYYISDDMQSIHKGLSTFGAEIIKLNQIIQNAKIETGFIALDEFARGTNPKEGCILAKSICEYFNKCDSIVLLSTHYDNVANSALEHYQVVGLKNVDFNLLKRKIDLNKSFSVQIIQDHMDYRLEKVSSKNEVPKDALNISILLGLEKEVINLINKHYEGD
ncbi:MutS domain V [Alkalithermobacter thermoalcaliphilus JW-YL-7 = DSM 7308]|uniref:DNA mismatch repair protein MutS domain protein n=1 Tax=Alkalithermobacter thermoalcaliphilus JW-YL-7 = DSM 7308 TaxID=1121328 RepID=A0A150FRB0_CLOPD|nr:DNA mismatch repair protein MutS domain protein [[Clostridium] paradoxum JW-YL-7 = DSM 7308]SHK45155.1 MutS domain V [[Clostridium] paradoxum JW-YL-7 = DSM 7308]